MVTSLYTVASCTRTNLLDCMKTGTQSSVYLVHLCILTVNKGFNGKKNQYSAPCLLQVCLI